jgi:MFS family permease
MESLHAWHEFYLLLGTAGATLLALLFVAVSLGTGYLSDKHQQGTRTFMSPVVIHFTSVFFISAVCLVPSHGPVFFAVLIGATAVIGIAVSIVITVWVVRTELTQYAPDYFAYALLPVGAYLALLAASIMIYFGWAYALEVLGGGLLVLAIVNIRNAWDLTLSMVRRHAGERSSR